MMGSLVARNQDARLFANKASPCPHGGRFERADSFGLSFWWSGRHVGGVVF